VRRLLAGTESRFAFRRRGRVGGSTAAPRVHP
jgi:hypothetical protein